MRVPFPEEGATRKALTESVAEVSIVTESIETDSRFDREQAGLK